MQQQHCGCTHYGYKNNKSPTSPYILISYGRRGGRKDRAWVKDLQSSCSAILAFSAAFSGSNNISAGVHSCHGSRDTVLPRSPILP